MTTQLEIDTTNAKPSIYTKIRKQVRKSFSTDSWQFFSGRKPVQLLITISLFSILWFYIIILQYSFLSLICVTIVWASVIGKLYRLCKGENIVIDRKHKSKDITTLDLIKKNTFFISSIFEARNIFISSYLLGGTMSLLLLLNNRPSYIGTSFFVFISMLGSFFYFLNELMFNK